MSFPELLAAVRGLKREEKIQLLTQLKSEVAELTEEEAKIARCFPSGAFAEIREPVYAPEAAAILLGMLAAEKRKE